MSKIPPSVRQSFDKIRKESSSYLVLKEFNKKYYVYKHTGIWDRERKKTRTKAEYIGKITEDGIFVPKATKPIDNLKTAEDMIRENGGVVTWPQEGVTYSESGNIEVDDADRKLLMALSMNARLPIPRLAKLAGLSEQATHTRVKILEEKLGIKYLLETDIEKLGYIRYLILIKFENELPTLAELEELIKDEDKIQFAATTKGEYDVIMYVIDEAPLTVNNNLYRLRTKPAIKKYGAIWNLIYFAEVYSFMPLKDKFIENVLKDKIWHKSKETPHFDRSKLKEREFALLKELNKNSNCNFTTIDQKFNFDPGASRYVYHMLKQNGIIVRPTITLSNLPFQYLGVILITNIHEDKIQAHRYKYLFEIIEYNKLANKYSLMGNIGAPNGGVMFIPVDANESIDKTVEKITIDLQGSDVKSLIITSILTGSLCYRRLDNTYTKQYNRLIEFQKITPKKLINYD